MTIERHVEGPLLRVTLSRPEKLNALNGGTRQALADMCAWADEHNEIRVIVLEGAGRAFSAGADLGSGSTTRDDDEDWATRRRGHGAWQRLLEHFDRLSQVTVARLHSHVIGGAALLAAACDIRVAADDTTLRIPELAVGLPLTWAGIPLLVREVGLPLTRDWVMSGRPVDAVELQRCGFAQRMVARTDLDAAVEACVGQLIDAAAAPLAMTRAMTSAIGRSSPAMLSGWADPDLLHWSLGDEESRRTGSAYNARRRG